MGYCDILYRPANILGYSGSLNSNPTVYFASESRDEHGSIKTKRVGNVDQILFLNGHITQHHSRSENIGREIVMESYSYSIMNVNPRMIAGGRNLRGQRLQETFHQNEVPVTGNLRPTEDGFSDFHVSRSVFTPVNINDRATLMKLEKAISRFPKIKPRYGSTSDDYIVRMSRSD